ncbi:hypothetical protein BST61_g11468 [Cercospora zeina]
MSIAYDPVFEQLRERLAKRHGRTVTDHEVQRYMDRKQEVAEDKLAKFQPKKRQTSRARQAADGVKEQENLPGVGGQVAQEQYRSQQQQQQQQECKTPPDPEVQDRVKDDFQSPKQAEEQESHVVFSRPSGVKEESSWQAAKEEPKRKQRHEQPIRQQPPKCTHVEIQARLRHRKTMLPSTLACLWLAIQCIAALWLAFNLLVWACSCLGIRPAGIAPPLPPGMATRLQISLPLRVKKYGNALLMLDDAQNELTYAHNAHCHTLEAICQLVEEPSTHPFYEAAMEMWLSGTKRSCPQPAACKKSKQYRAAPRNSRQIVVLDWEREMVKLLVEAGAAIHDGVQAGDALLSTFLSGTETLQRRMKEMHEIAAESNGSRRVKPYITWTSVTWMCRFHSSSQANTVLHGLLVPFCTIIPPILAHLTIDYGSVDALWTYQWVVDMNAAYSNTVEIVHETGQHAKEHIRAMKSSGGRCAAALDALTQKAGVDLSPLAVKLHQGIDAACQLLKGDSKSTWSIKPLNSHLSKLLHELPTSPDTAFPLIVFWPSAALRYENVLVFNAESVEAVQHALAMWRTWDWIAVHTGISSAVENANRAMEWKRIGEKGL